MDKHSNNSMRSSFLGSTPHPSSPISAGATTSTAPRLSSFGRRFRSPPPAPINPQVITQAERTAVQERNAEAVKSAKRFLHANLRSDWDYNASLPPTQADIISSTRLKDLEDVNYKKREDGSSDPGSSDDDRRDPMAWTDGENTAYKYESPDAIAAALATKKRKRRRLLKEEMQYNEGLRVFHERRNAWTGAVSQKPHQVLDEDSLGNPQAHIRNASSSPNFEFEFEGSSRGSRGPSHASVSRASSAALSEKGGQGQEEEIGSEAESERSPSEPSQDTYGVDVDPFLPIAPPLLPRTNPVRAAITPSMYPTIYSKVVVQSLTPSVPIPLPDITKAMVQGWRDEGNWPPRSTIPVNEVKNVAASTAINKDKERKEGGMRKGMSGAFRKALGLRPHHPSTTASGSSGHGPRDGNANGARPGSGTGAGTESVNKQEFEDAEAMFEEG